MFNPRHIIRSQEDLDHVDRKLRLWQKSEKQHSSCFNLDSHQHSVATSPCWNYVEDSELIDRYTRYGAFVGATHDDAGRNTKDQEAGTSSSDIRGSASSTLREECEGVCNFSSQGPVAPDVYDTNTAVAAWGRNNGYLDTDESPVSGDNSLHASLRADQSNTETQVVPLNEQLNVRLGSPQLSNLACDNEGPYDDKDTEAEADKPKAQSFASCFSPCMSGFLSRQTSTLKRTRNAFLQRLKGRRLFEKAKNDKQALEEMEKGQEVYRQQMPEGADLNIIQLSIQVKSILGMLTQAVQENGRPSVWVEHYSAETVLSTKDTTTFVWTRDRALEIIADTIQRTENLSDDTDHTQRRSLNDSLKLLADCFQRRLSESPETVFEPTGHPVRGAEAEAFFREEISTHMTASEMERLPSCVVSIERQG